MKPGLTWAALTAITSIVFSMSQLQAEHQDRRFARDLCRHALGRLMAAGL
jgi:hypothetical protein